MSNCVGHNYILNCELDRLQLGLWLALTMVESSKLPFSFTAAELPV